ncbi:MAG: transposase [Prevotellaceae bacterium]|nr:transposase [Prevotellaceae bacterium]
MSSKKESKPYKAEFNHSYTRRNKTHDYYAPFIYHIILKKDDRCVPFGAVKGDARIAPGKDGCAYIERSDIGNAIAKELFNLQKNFAIVKIYQYCIMPDHVHILMRIMERSDKHLGFYINHLKANIHKHFDEEIFQANYTDKPLYRQRSLDSLFRYIRENPHRLAMRQQHPYFFQHTRQLTIGNKAYEAYGNLFLFRNPDKEAVKISRAFSEEEKTEKKTNWLSAASKGTILVSPFISKDEKNIRSEAESLGAHIILITHETFPDRFKPSAHDFALCSAGRLLIISLGEQIHTELTRNICQRMNALAVEIASE